MRLRYLNHVVASLVLTTAVAARQAPATGPATGTASFVIVLRGARVGSETVSLTRRSGGWTIASSGHQDSPVPLDTSRFEMSYGADWQPEKLVIEAAIRQQPLTMTTTFGVTTAISDLTQAGKTASTSHEISPRAVILPNSFYGAYEALAARVAAAPIGSRLPVYVPPQGEISVVIDRVTPKRIVTPSSAAEFRQFNLTFFQATGLFPVELWVDAHDRLAKLTMPVSAVTVIRDDLASVMAREEITRNKGDADVFVPSLGFNLAATRTSPTTPGDHAAVVLVPSIAARDRDQATGGVPIFAQIAGAIADAGMDAVRYDPRGVGQSGGRIESATLADYADDLVRVVDWLRRSKGVDGDRVAVVSYGDGSAVALLAAARTGKIRGVAMLAAPGTTGRDAVLAQQTRLLARTGTPEEERKAKIALQQQVIDATISGTGWTGVDPMVRYQVDTPLFKSWLLFDPAKVLKSVDQPLLVLTGSLDTEVSPDDADRLEALGHARKTSAVTRKVIVSGVNHLFVPATTGTVDEYATLASTSVAPQVTSALTRWLDEIIGRRK